MGMRLGHLQDSLSPVNSSYRYIHIPRHGPILTAFAPLSISKSIQDPPELIEPNKIMVFEGLHPIYDEKALSLLLGDWAPRVGLRALVWGSRVEG